LFACLHLPGDVRDTAHCRMCADRASRGIWVEKAGMFDASQIHGEGS
jgi:hypothetical protein